jgi:Ca2+-transporting ATPase
LLTFPVARTIALRGIVEAGSALAAFVFVLEGMDSTEETARTVGFVTIIMGELLIAYSSRSYDISAARMNLWGNPWLLLAIGFSFALLLTAVYVPGLQGVFGNEPLGVREWAIASLLATLPFVVIEAAKLVRPGPARQKQAT